MRTITIIGAAVFLAPIAIEPIPETARAILATITMLAIITALIGTMLWVAFKK
jgi:hypothetical protein